MWGALIANKESRREMSDNIIISMWADRVRILERIKVTKLDSYDYLQKRLSKTNVAADLEYQSKYIGFYVMGRRPAGWYSCYFNLLEQQKKNRRLLFEETLRNIHSSTRRVEPSFSSKLVATVRPEMPVYDSLVLANLNIKRPRSYVPADIRLTDALRAYEEIQTFHEDLLRYKFFQKLKSEFDRRFSQFSHFTDAKKLDILLWQWRDRR